MAEYKVQFEVFEGPLDLLLYLIKKEEVDIYEVNLTKLATQFIEYIDLMREFDLEVAGEFLVMASTLMYIKSRELLPVDQQVAVEGEDEGEDPRWELIRQLVEYKKFKDAAAQLQTLEAARKMFSRACPENWNLKAPRRRPNRTSPFSTCSTPSTASSSASKSEDGDPRHFRGQMDRQRKNRVHPQGIIAERGSVRFSELFESAASRAKSSAPFWRCWN
jgi:segregation and condensation protein A